jgi:Restriction endonuclease BglII
MELTESYVGRFSARTLTRYEMIEVRDATAILAAMNPLELAEIGDVLGRFKLERADIVKPGGQEGPVAKRLNLAFREREWREGRHDLTIGSSLRLMPYRKAGEKKPRVAESEVVSRGYKVDNVKGRIALDVEWNAKDGNLDRDLSAYRALYDAGIIAAGVILTRTQADMRELGTRLGRDPFGTSTTTNLDKLIPRMKRGDGGGCPILAVAITARCFGGRR